MGVFNSCTCSVSAQRSALAVLSFLLGSLEKSCCSRVRSRRVPVLRLGSWGPGGDQKSLRLCSPSVRKRLQASASVGECRASSGVANVTGIGGVVVTKRRLRVSRRTIAERRVCKHICKSCERIGKHVFNIADLKKTRINVMITTL